MEHIISKQLSEKVIKTLRAAKQNISILSDNEMVRTEQPKNREDAKLENAISELIPQLETLLAYRERIKYNQISEEEFNLIKSFGVVETIYQQVTGKKIEIKNSADQFNATRELNQLNHLEC